MQKNGRQRRQEKEGNKTCLGPSPRQTRVRVCSHPAAYTTSSSVRGDRLRNRKRKREQRQILTACASLVCEVHLI